MNDIHKLKVKDKKRYFMQMEIKKAGVTIFISDKIDFKPGVSNPWHRGHMWLKMAMNTAQHKIVNLLKTL